MKSNFSKQTHPLRFLNSELVAEIWNGVNCSEKWYIVNLWTYFRGPSSPDCVVVRGQKESRALDLILYGQHLLFIPLVKDIFKSPDAGSSGSAVVLRITWKPTRVYKERNESGVQQAWADQWDDMMSIYYSVWPSGLYLITGASVAKTCLGSVSLWWLKPVPRVSMCNEAFKARKQH